MQYNYEYKFVYKLFILQYKFNTLWNSTRFLISAKARRIKSSQNDRKISATSIFDHPMRSANKPHETNDSTWFSRIPWFHIYKSRPAFPSPLFSSFFFVSFVDKTGMQRVLLRQTLPKLIKLHFLRLLRPFFFLLSTIEKRP